MRSISRKVAKTAAKAVKASGKLAKAAANAQISTNTQTFELNRCKKSGKVQSFTVANVNGLAQLTLSEFKATDTKPWSKMIHVLVDKLGFTNEQLPNELKLNQPVSGSGLRVFYQLVDKIFDKATKGMRPLTTGDYLYKVVDNIEAGNAYMVIDAVIDDKGQVTSGTVVAKLGKGCDGSWATKTQDKSQTFTFSG
jgi:hypothetical protein